MTTANLPTKTTEGFGTLTAERSAELAAVAVAAAAKAEVESAYVMAIRKPRNEDDARAAVVRLAANPFFAKKARYRKPVGKKDGVMQFIEGPSVRFAEAIAQSWGNLFVKQTVIYDDETKRIVGVAAKDLERNTNYSGEVTVQKLVERRYADDRKVVGERTNSSGQKVYIVVATEDEILNKVNANVSKLLRNQVLRLIPQHLVDEAMSICADTVAKGIKADPDAEKKKIVDEFFAIGVRVADLEKYLDHPWAQVTADELVELRGILTTIDEGSAKWADYVTEKSGGEGSTAEDRKQQIADGQARLKAQQATEAFTKAGTSNETGGTPAATKAPEPETKQPEPEAQPAAAETKAPEPEKATPADPVDGDDPPYRNPKDQQQIDANLNHYLYLIQKAKDAKTASSIFNKASALSYFSETDRKALLVEMKERLQALGKR